MMDRLFRIDFYPSDWILKTGKMTLEQRGLYIQICALIYAHRGPIENDANWIARVSGCSTRMAKAVIGQLVDMGSIQIQGSKISQERCERELSTKRAHLECSAKGGRVSAEKRPLSSKNNALVSSDPTRSLSSSSASATAIATESSVDDPALTLVKMFDARIVACWGPRLARLCPASNDLLIAKGWIAAGMSRRFVEDHLIDRMARMKAAGKQPPGSLAFFDRSLRERGQVASAATPGDAPTPTSPEVQLDGWRQRVAFWRGGGGRGSRPGVRSPETGAVDARRSFWLPPRGGDVLETRYGSSLWLVGACGLAGDGLRTGLDQEDPGYGMIRSLVLASVLVAQYSGPPTAIRGCNLDEQT